MYLKNFDQWNFVKQKINSRINSKRLRVGEVCWVVIGVNIGEEIDGKGRSFTRPALVVYVFGTHMALVIPCSTKIKLTVGYYPFLFRDKTMSLCLHQIRIISQKRILTRWGQVSSARLAQIKNEIKKFYSF